MKHTSLTAKYRPQTFAAVAGQDTLKAILSRAAAEDKVAPAYLFSGTRGVGKTTVARVFAKALNCRSAPAPEPCNACDLCKAVALGNAVDVVEIDGASNRGIDDVRRLKEVVGYAPMEGRYKVFIIDEAHMLSREAFNALLKTLEEPPARVTFVLATTEPHKFPATIISRCQHYVFRRLSEAGLVAHLSSVLEREGMEFEAAAVRLMARRGAGSVRDSMSLLSQVLALGAGKLTEESARSVLGLAGQEAMARMLAAFRQGEGLALVDLLRDMLEQGLDMGFFLRELGALWRNLFLLRQNGEAALGLLELSEAEGRALLEEARQFSLSHIHACWQMTLEGQRRVLTSLEPAQALELLFLNLAMLPQLLSLEELSALGRRSAPAGQQAAPRVPAAPRPAPATARVEAAPRPDAAVPLSGPQAAVRPAVAPAPEARDRDDADEDEDEPAPPFSGFAPEDAPAQAVAEEERSVPPAAEAECFPPPAVTPEEPPVRPARKHYDQLRQEVREHPLVKSVVENFDATIVSFGQNPTK